MGNEESTQEKVYILPGGFGDLAVLMIEVRHEMELLRQSREDGSGDAKVVTTQALPPEIIHLIGRLEGVVYGQQKQLDGQQKQIDGIRQQNDLLAQLLTAFMQGEKVSHLNDAEEATTNKAAISETPSETPQKAEINRAKLVRWVRANPGKAKTMGIRKIAKATGVNPATTGKFIKDYREGKITI